MPHTVKAVAKLAGISIRTLHHYDHVGLLKPSSVSPSGYRHYGEADLERLQQILFFRELDFSLTEIKAILDRPDFDRRAALKTHRLLLLEKQKRLETLIRSVDRTIDAMERGIPMSNDTMFEGFDQKQIEEWRLEAREKYGHEIVDASYRRASTYNKQDWAAIQDEMQAIGVGMAAAMDGDPASPEAQALVDRWFRLINDRFYACTPEIFRGLGDLYVDDSRFTAFYDQVRPGLASFMRAAMHHYVDAMAGETR